VLDIFPPSERKAFFGRGVFQFANDHQAFVEYHIAKNEITFASSETPINDFIGNGPFVYPAGGPFYPGPFVAGDGRTITPTGDVTLAWRGKQAGLRTNRVDSDEERVVAGLTGVLLGWDYNTAFIQAKSKAVDNYVDGWMRESVLNRNIRTGRVDVFTGNPQTAEGQRLIDEAKILQVVRRAEGKTTGFDGKVSRELMEMRSGPLALAAGFDHRKEEVEDNPASVLSSGDVLGGGGNQPAWSADRKVTAFFAELSVPILRNLEAQLAVRTDDYSDFGRTTNPKAAVRWNPTQALLVRSSYSTGFRAPTLADLHLPRFFSNTAEAHNDPIRCIGGEPLGDFVNPGLECDAQFQNQLGGNANLTPEKSRQWTLGVIFEPTAGASVGADFWAINRRNSLGYVSDQRIFNEIAAADPLGAAGYFVRAPRNAAGGCVGDLPGAATPANVPCQINYAVMVQENLGKFQLRGVDLSASARLGPVWLRADGTYVHRYRFQWKIDGPYVDNAGRFVAENYSIPRWRHYISANWRTGPLGFTLAQNYILGYRDSSDTRRVATYETYDLQALWEGWKGLGVTLGVKNILDRDPPASDQRQTFQLGYDPRSGVDPRGRMYYAALKYKFK
jgi:iron complex outermembrane receptor protein